MFLLGRGDAGSVVTFGGRSAGAHLGPAPDPLKSTFAHRSVTVDALNFDGSANLSVQIPVAVYVLHEVAVDTVHSFFEMDVHEVYRHVFAHLVQFRFHPGQFVRRPLALVELFDVLRNQHRHPQLLVGDIVNLGAERIEQDALAVLFVNGAVDPAVTVKICKLRMLGLCVQVGHICQKLRIRQVAPRRRVVRVGHLGAHELFGGGILMLGRIYQFSVGLLVPPQITKIAIHHGCARMNVTDDALTGRDGLGETMRDWMSDFVLRNHRIDISDKAVSHRPRSFRGCRTWHTDRNELGTGR